MAQPLIVIGAGLAGWTTVREFRKLDSTTPVMLVTADSGDFYAKPSLSNALAQHKAPAQLVTTSAATMAQTLNVTLHAHTEVQAIDTTHKRVATSRGVFGYGRLALALGAQPLRLPLAGAASPSVLSVNSLDDFARLHARLRPASRVLVIGAGLIGCEFANDLAASGHAVTVVDPNPLPLAALLPAGAGERLRDALAAIGVQWRLGHTVQSVEPDGQAVRVRLAPAGGTGRTPGAPDAVPADLVLSAVGLRAQTALASAAGIRCEQGIVVDTQLRTSADGVFALGDCAQYASAGGRTLPFVMPLMAAARTLAAVLAGRDERLQFGVMPVAVKTPALPVVVAPPAAGRSGQWHEAEPGLWQHLGPQRQPQGFVLAGQQTARRQEQARLLAPL